MDPPAVSVSGVWKRFGHRDALAGVSFDAPAGACTAVLGPNGCGKTTLLRIVASLGRANEGEVRVFGHPLPQESRQARARIGVVMRRTLLPSALPVGDALRLYADLFAVPAAAERIESLLARVGLSSRVRDPVRTLSRGMGQRAALCRALLHDPDLLLLDEPYTGLDIAAARLVDEIVRERVAAGKSVLLVTHDLARAARLASYAVVLDRGRLAFVGEPDEAAQAAGTAAEANG